MRTTARTSFRQYMPKKPTKRSFKVWTRCGVSAFVYEMILHHGSSKSMYNADGLVLPDLSLKRSSSQSTTAKAMNTTKSIDARGENFLKQFGSLGLVVLHLVKDVPDESTIFIDNYFSSTKLIKELTQLGYRITCTLGLNRTENCPISTEQEFAKKQRDYYESFVSSDNTCIVVGWKNSKSVIRFESCRCRTKNEIKTLEQRKKVSS